MSIRAGIEWVFFDVVDVFVGWGFSCGVSRSVGIVDCIRALFEFLVWRLLITYMQLRKESADINV